MLGGKCNESTAVAKVMLGDNMKPDNNQGQQLGVGTREHDNWERVAN